MKRILCFVGWHGRVYRETTFIPSGWTVFCAHCGKRKT